MRLLLFIVAALATSPPGTSHAETCPVVPLQADFQIGDLKDTAPADGIACFDLRFPEGQNLSIELVSGRNVSISVPGHYDDRTDRMFLGNLPGRLEIRVYQLMRAVEPEPFAVRIRFEAPGNG